MLEQSETERKEFCSLPVSEEAEVADAHKAARQQVKQEAAQELFDRQGHEPLWAYWHAVAATPHIAAVHFGAALESLQRAYLSSTAGPRSSKIVDDGTWEKIRTSLESFLDCLRLPSDACEALKNKIRNLNNRSQHSTGKYLVGELGLVLSDREKQAHDTRHESAHGKDDEVDVEWVRGLKLLRIRFHRIFLAMTGANDEYYDYFTLDHPIRQVKEPVPES